MKKILFNDKYGLTAAVLNGTKTQTRRVINVPSTFLGFLVGGLAIIRNPNGKITDVCLCDDDGILIDDSHRLPKYKVGEIVAVAQAYKEFMSVEEHTKFLFNERNGLYMGYPEINPEEARKDIRKFIGNSNGWTNKMFVKADLMPHQIRITRVWIERLQDISDEDCLKEGIVPVGINGDVFYKHGGTDKFCDTPRKAYAALIDKISGKGTWESNPYVYCYEFELVK